MAQTNLHKSFKHFPDNWKECCYALVCLPYRERIPADQAKALMKRYKLSAAEMKQFEKTLKSYRWLEGEWAESSSWYWSQPAGRLTPIFYTSVLPTMTAEVIARHISEEKLTGSVRASQKTEYHVPTSTYLRFIEAASASGKFRLSEKEQAFHGFMYVLGELLVFLAVDPRFESFIEKLSEELKTSIFDALVGGNSIWHVSGMFDQARKALGFTKADIDKKGDIAIHTWGHISEGTLLDFFREGHPEVQVRYTHEAYPESWLLQSVIAIEKGSYSEAVKYARKALQVNGSRRYFANPAYNWLLGLAYYMNRHDARTIQYMEKDSPDWDLDACVLLRPFYALAKSETSEEYADSNDLKLKPEAGKNDWGFEPVFKNAVLMNAHVGDLPADQMKKLISGLEPDAKRYPVIGQILEQALNPGSEKAQALEKQLGMKPLLPVMKKVSSWEKILDNLLMREGVNPDMKAGKTKKSEAQTRFAFAVAMDDLTVTPREQKSTDGINWTKGRTVPLSLFSPDLPQLSDQDRRVAKLAKRHGINTKEASYLGGPEVILALAGHPAVYKQVRGGLQHVKIVKETFQLSVKKEESGWRISSNADEYAKEGEMLKKRINIRETGDGNIAVLEATEADRELLARLKKAGPMPAEAEGKLTRLLESVSRRMPVMSDLLKGSERLEKRKGSAMLTVQLTPSEENRYAVAVFVRPLAGCPVTCAPGKGSEFLAGAVQGLPVQIVRQKSAEQKNFDAFSAAVASLEHERTDDTHWLVDAEGCLEILQAAHDLGDQCKTEWPAGERFRVSHNIMNASALQLSVRSLGSWFEVEGKAAVDGKTKLKISELLSKLQEMRGNFIELKEGEFLKLTEDLKRELGALSGLAGTGKGATKIAAAHAPLVESLEADGAQVEADNNFKDLVERLEKAQTARPRVPKNLQAELRDYQVEGYRWMMRLSGWGAGALLADDMGLGKTLQTIAVLLARADEGAQLVVAPASVLLNWQGELERFAPSLKQVILNQEKDRAAAIKAAGAGTVCLTTYGVMTGESEAFAEKEWATFVLDEAHAVKNRDTKGFKAAASLKGSFRILLTGTPLQNHLTEIWALFEIANPGLLGSFQHFTETFVLPVERDEDHGQQRLLKRIVSPFILRRTKNDVLDELPEKTETLIRVTLSDEERALYESIREQAMLELEGSDNPLQALAALTKLRQAACHPALVDPSLPIPSSKTAAFLHLAADLIEAGHRALVFSQFTSHLALVRAQLDRLGIAYLYLDGTMSPTERTKKVETFQKGTTPLFLISLKAGGTGLNLTAADYVIHLDPWWNPAIEDQASDRAYRIGQERPVTIYRLIAKDTVEEKILKLHATKKSLADALLEGTGMSHRLGKKEILELLQLAQ